MEDAKNIAKNYNPAEDVYKRQVVGQSFLKRKVLLWI